MGGANRKVNPPGREDFDVTTEPEGKRTADACCFDIPWMGPRASPMRGRALNQSLGTPP